MQQLQHHAEFHHWWTCQLHHEVRFLRACSNRHPAEADEGIRGTEQGRGLILANNAQGWRCPTHAIQRMGNLLMQVPYFYDN